MCVASLFIHESSLYISKGYSPFEDLYGKIRNSVEAITDLWPGQLSESPTHYTQSYGPFYRQPL